MKTTQEMIEVMQKHGSSCYHIEARLLNGDPGWYFHPDPSWCWKTHDYRAVMKDPIAQGHNPANLTESQVGVIGGWRLLMLEEIAVRGESKDIQRWDGDTWDFTGWTGSLASNTYRTKMPPGYFLPKKKKTAAMQAEDYPPVFWVRRKSRPDEQLLCLAIHGAWLSFSSNLYGYDGHQASTYAVAGIDVKNPRPCEYSADRKTWLSCTKEVEE